MRRALAAAAVASWLPALACAPGSTPPPAEPGAAEPSAVAPTDSIEIVAHGNEPFWSVRVTVSGVELREPDRPDGVRGDYQPPARVGATFVFRTVLGDSAATPLELTLEEKPCNDTMSEKMYAYAASARVGDRLLRGCAERRPATAAGSAAAPALEFGDWTVVGHRMPGISAMTEAEAVAWIGRVARYGPDLAAFGAETCHRPSYQARTVRGDSLLQVGYRAAPSALGLAPRAAITLIEVSCGGSGWIGPGGTLLRLPEGTTYMVWDGTFFELRRKVPEGGS